MRAPELAYDAGAEYYDLLTAQWWEARRPTLTAALRSIDPAAGPVVELGAGTGLATTVIADTLPTAAIVAVEPATPMRAVLTARVARSDALARRITIVPGLDDLAGPGPARRWGALIAVNMVGHLGPDERRALWAQAATRLAPGAPVVVGPLPTSRPQSLPVQCWGRARLGRHDYELWSGMEPTGPQTVRWRMVWRVLAGGRVVEERTANNDMWTVEEAALLDELSGAGLRTTGREGDFLVLRPGAPGRAAE